MTEEESFSTIKITKKIKNADSSPTYAPLRGEGLLGKKDKKALDFIKSKYFWCNIMAIIMCLPLFAMECRGTNSGNNT
jgi:hypothetical protein